jgi:hypothetical protein
MCDPLYELLAFKVLSLGIRECAICALINLRFSLPSTVAGWTSSEFAGPSVSQSHTSTCPRRPRSRDSPGRYSHTPRVGSVTIPSHPHDIHMSNPETRSTELMCVPGMLYNQALDVVLFVLMTRKIWYPPWKCFTSFQLT